MPPAPQFSFAENGAGRRQLKTSQTLLGGASYFFFGVDLAAWASFFFCAALWFSTCFCLDFFWTDFGDLSPII